MRFSTLNSALFLFSNYAITPTDEHERFLITRYTVLRSIIPPFLFTSFSQFYRQTIKAGLLSLDDGQSKRFYMANDRVGRFMQFAFTDLVRKIVAHNCQPSYVYFGGYVGGAVLKPHADRFQCEFTMSINIYQNPADKPWPLALSPKLRFEKDGEFQGGYLEMPAKEDQVLAPLYEGDVLLFMGRHLNHWRVGPQPEGHETYNVFLHYVQDNFEKVLD